MDERDDRKKAAAKRKRKRLEERRAPRERGRMSGKRADEDEDDAPECKRGAVAGAVATATRAPSTSITSTVVTPSSRNFHDARISSTPRRHRSSRASMSSSNPSRIAANAAAYPSSSASSSANASNAHASVSVGVSSSPIDRDDHAIEGTTLRTTHAEGPRSCVRGGSFVAAIVDDSGLQFVEPAGEFGCGPIFVFGAAADADCPEPAVACPTWPDVVAAVGRAQDAGAFEG